MSIKYMNDAWDMPLNPTEKIVLLALADWANDDGLAYPGYKKLTQKTGMAESSLSKCIKILKGIGILEVSNHSVFGNGKKVNVYQIKLRSELPITCTLLLLERIKELRKEHARTYTCILGAPKLASSVPNTCILGDDTSVIHISSDTSVTTRATETQPVIVKPKPTEKKPTTKKTVVEILADFGITEQLADDFIEHRKKKEAVITKTAMDGFQKQADKAGISIIDAVKIAIDRNWAGFNANWDWNPEKKQVNNGFNGHLSKAQQRSQDSIDVLNDFNPYSNLPMLEH